MNLVLAKNHDCMIAAFAAAARVTPEYLIERIGHDGQEIVDGLTVGFHAQEIVDVLLRANMAATCIEKNPVSLMSVGGSYHLIKFPEGNQERFDKHVGCTRHGVLQCQMANGQGHAVAVDGYEGVVYDPRGRTYPYADLHKQGLDPFALWKLTTR